MPINTSNLPITRSHLTHYFHFTCLYRTYSYITEGTKMPRWTCLSMFITKHFIPKGKLGTVNWWGLWILSTVTSKSTPVYHITNLIFIHFLQFMPKHIMCMFNKTILFINSLTVYLKAAQTKKLYILLWRGFTSCHRQKKSLTSPVSCWCHPQTRRNVYNSAQKSQRKVLQWRTK